MKEATEVIGVIDLKSMSPDLLINKRSSKFFSVSISTPPRLIRGKSGESSSRSTKPPESLVTLDSSSSSKRKLSFLSWKIDAFLR